MGINSCAVAAKLTNELGWTPGPDGMTFTKRIVGFAPAGTVSDGTRVVTLEFCDRARYFSRVDMGLSKVVKDVDLREVTTAQEAIDKVLAD